MKRSLRPTSIATLLLLAGCGVGGALAASGGGGGGGGGSKRPPPPPTVSVISPGESAGNLITFAYVLRDPQVKGTEQDPGGEADPRVAVVCEWQPTDGDPAVWFPMTESDVPDSDGTRGLSLGQHRFVWNTIPDLGAFQGRIRVRVTATYEDVAGITRQFRTEPVLFNIDNRLVDTVFGQDRQPANDVDTFPVDIRPFGAEFVVGCLGANIVEKVDASGFARRVIGVGVPGDNLIASNTPRNPGVARLPTLIGFDVDGAGNFFTNHINSIVVTNRGALPLPFGSIDVPAQSSAYASVIETTTPLENSRGMRVHPSGALLFMDNRSSGATVEAFNPRDTGVPSPPIVLAGVAIPAGGRATIAGGGGSEADDVGTLAAVLTDLQGLAVGPAGEIYIAERGKGRVRVFNPGAAPVTIAGSPVAPGTIRTVAGTGLLGFSGDGGTATAAQFNLPSSIDVRADGSLFVADTGNVRIRLVNLGAGDVTFAETTVSVGQVGTVVGGGTGGDGSKATNLNLRIPNACAVDTAGNLLIADERSVYFVNGTTATATSYGRTAGAARAVKVYDSSRRGGLPLSEPRAMATNSPNEVYFTDRTTIRVLNLTTTPRVFGGDSAGPGEVAVVGGGAVEGFAGDGGSARSASFSQPLGLALEGPRRLYVADTLSDRVRFVNTGDPRLVASESEFVLGQTVSPGNVTTIVGGNMSNPLNDGDGLTPTQASLLRPESVAVGNDGVIYVADTGHHRVRAVNPGASAITVAGVTIQPGTIQTIVGTGAPGFTADGAGPWQIDSPSSLTLDSANVLYIGLRGNSRIRAINLGSTDVVRAGITIQPNRLVTLVGTGVAGNAGDGGGGPEAQITTPRGLFVQSRSSGEPVALYFADESAHVVRLLNLSATDDLAVTLDARGQVLVTAPAASVVMVAGGPNTVGFPNAPAFQGDGGTVQQVRFSRPSGIAVTNRNNQPAHFFVADTGNLRLRRLPAPPLVVTNP